MDLHAIEINKKKVMEGKCARSVLALPVPDQDMTVKNLNSNQVCEAQKTAEKESDVAMVAREKTSGKETNLEERYEIMVAAEHEDGELGNLMSEERLQLAPIFQSNCTAINTPSDIQGPEAAETSIQNLEQGNRNLVLNDKGDEDFNECQKDGAEAEVDGDEDYFFPSVEDVEKARPPEVGMVFVTLQDAHRFINVYGLLTGFVVKKGCNYKHKKITFVCNKSSKMKDNGTGQRKRRRNAIEKTGCRMKVLVKLVGGGRLKQLTMNIIIHL